MKNKKIPIIIGIVSLSVSTAVICSCFSERATVATTVYAPADSAETSSVSDNTLSETNTNIPENDSKSPTESTTENLTEKDVSHSENSESGTSDISQTGFDDPESYLEYNPINGTYFIPDDEKEFCEQSLFVGDSICNGFYWSGVLQNKNLYASPSVGARNMLTYDMTYCNEPKKFVPVLNTLKPKNIFFWMGMNDVNLTDSKEYCENYKKIIDTALKNSDAEVYVCGITPISNLKFTKKETINEFNDAIRRFVEHQYDERVHYLYFGEPLKDANGLLAEDCDSGDGVHLSCKAHYIAMHEIFVQSGRKNQ